MAILLALLSSALYGAGDFVGGLAARRLVPLFVGFLTHSVVVAPMFALAAVVGAGHVDGADLAWGAAGAITGGIAVILFYKALAAGPMSIVSPLAAVVSVVVPVAVGLAQGERPSQGQWVGIVLVVVAIVLITRTDAEEEMPDGHRPHAPSMHVLRPATAVASIGAGIGFGFYFVSLDQTSPDSGLWPIAAGRVTSALLFAVLVLFTPSARPTLARLRERGTMALVVGAAFGDVSANALYLFAVRRGQLSIVSVLAALYPAATVLLAQRLLHERSHRAQQVGLGVAVVAVALVAGA